jgi:hypothetical protein
LRGATESGAASISYGNAALRMMCGLRIVQRPWLHQHVKGAHHGRPKNIQGDNVKGHPRLGWDEAKHAVRAGWQRIERMLPGDADGDGH